MTNNKSVFFQGKETPGSLCVLTITATFPSLIQPWLVNQLAQIVENGGDNRILARRSDMAVYASSIDRYNLLTKFRVISESKTKLIISLMRLMLNYKTWRAFFKSLLRYPAILGAKQYSLKEKLYAALLAPYFGLSDIDLIHSHSEMAGNKFMPIIDALNRPLVVTFHGLPPVGVKPIEHEERIRYVSRASIILVNTQFAKKQYVSLGATADKIKIIPQGINLDDFPFKLRSFPQDEICILTVGRYHHDKGQKYAIEAIAELVHAGVNLRYRLVGNGPDLENLKQLTIQLGIDKNVEFYRSLSDQQLSEIYQTSHIFILPSLTARDGLHEETQGVVLQEAQASGLIVIATNVGGIPECIDDGVSGFLVDDRSSKAIAARLTKIISSSEKWEEYQTLGRRWVEERYDIRVIGKKIKSLYANVIEAYPNKQ